MNEEYAFGDKMPSWMKAFLSSKGIPPQFTDNELSEEQWSIMSFAYTISQLEKKGLVKVKFDLNGLSIALTEKGRKVAERLKERGLI